MEDEEMPKSMMTRLFGDDTNIELENLDMERLDTGQYYILNHLLGLFVPSLKPTVF